MHVRKVEVCVSCVVVRGLRLPAMTINGVCVHCLKMGPCYELSRDLAMTDPLSQEELLKLIPAEKTSPKRILQPDDLPRY